VAFIGDDLLDIPAMQIAGSRSRSPTRRRR